MKGVVEDISFENKQTFKCRTWHSLLGVIILNASLALELHVSKSTKSSYTRKTFS